MRVLAFTTSYKRPSMVRQCILQMKAQTYAVDHSIYFAGADQSYDRLTDDLLVYSKRYGPNMTQQQNHLAAIGESSDSFDLYAKIDDDDVYKMRYIEEAVGFHHNTGCNVSSCAAEAIIVKRELRNARLHDLGGKHATSFAMPPTFVFDKIALRTIRSAQVPPGMFEDMVWRQLWIDAGLDVRIRPSQQFIYHIHDNNISRPG